MRKSAPAHVLWVKELEMLFQMAPPGEGGFRDELPFNGMLRGCFGKPHGRIKDAFARPLERILKNLSGKAPEY